jgi:uncharacterized membrane protein
MKEELVSNLVVVAYPEEKRAVEVMDALRRLQKEYLVDIEDAVYVTRDREGKLALHQSTNTAAAGAAGGALWGMLFGLLFFVPLAGLAIGAGTGFLIGKLADYGIDDKFVRQVSDNLKPGTSAIFVVVRRATPDKVIPEISKYGGTVLHTSLSKEAEDRLNAALAGQDVVTQAPTSATPPDSAQASTSTPAGA